MGKGLLKDLELGLSRSLAMLDLVGNIRIKLSKVDERRICAWGNEIWGARVGETWIVVRVVHGWVMDWVGGREWRGASAGGRGRRKEKEVERGRVMKYERRKNAI